MLKGIIRLFSFFAKELAEIRRQPRLILSLVLGPFLILLLFGVSFSGEQPKLQTLLVVPPEMANDPRVEEFKGLIGQANFNVVGVETDEQVAIQKLRASRGAIDVVEVLPADMNQLFGKQQQSPIKVIYNEIDPTQDQWVQYLSYVQVKELNTALLVQAVGGSQQELGSVDQLVSNAQNTLKQVQSGLNTASTSGPQVRAAIEQLRTNNGLLLAGLALSAQSDASRNAQSEMESIRSNLDALDQAIQSGQIDEQRARVQQISQSLDRVKQVSSQLKTVPPQVLVAPLQQVPQNLVQNPPSFIGYYAPGVLALLLQHMAITLAALSLVRETLLGSTELFRVAPVNTLQIILGKYIGFILAIVLVVAALVGLMVANIPIGSTGWTFGLAIPFNGDWYWFVGMVLLTTIASLGIGFLISSVSKSESQAVQLSMIALLAAVFFSGFFLPLGNFASFAQWLAFLLPVTHGVQAFQAIMLRGDLPNLESVLWLSGITLVCFLLSWIIWRSNLRRR